MAEPTKKSDQVEAALTGMFGFDRRETITKNICIPAPIGCGGPADKFDDELSVREYRISGLCQKCQDKIFGSDEELEEDQLSYLSGRNEDFR